MNDFTDKEKEMDARRKKIFVEEQSDRSISKNQVVEMFYKNGGKVPGPWEGFPLLLLTTIGAKSGRRHTAPLTYMRDGDRIILSAAARGAPRNPDWYYNLVAHPEVTLEIGTENGIETFDGIAEVTNEEKRSELWDKWVKKYPYVAEYQKATTRQFPMVIVRRKES